ncbi:hypothetical protein ACFFWD_03595 [Bradyrhizobium erythrophlei]|uniref:hypothetical protein n=1 Tax=Bradyrhizobium erythrophlei TaxID=1437360 RepID=UPI0035E7FDA1
MNYNIRGEHYTGELGPGGATDIRLTHHPRARSEQVNEAGPSSVRASAGQRVLDFGDIFPLNPRSHVQWATFGLMDALREANLMPTANRSTIVNICQRPYIAELVEGAVRLTPRAGQ